MKTLGAILQTLSSKVIYSVVWCFYLFDMSSTSPKRAMQILRTHVGKSKSMRMLGNQSQLCKRSTLLVVEKGIS